MLLRRVMEHVKAQNWFAVALDFLIVVIGVFMGLQVQEWNTERNDRISERRYLERLLLDFDNSLGQNASFIDFFVAQSERETLVLTSLKRCALEPKDADDFASGIFLSGRVLAPVLSRITIDGLEATGKWQAIQSVDLRRAISELIEQIDVTIDIDDRIRARVFPHINYIESQIYFRLDRPYAGLAKIKAEDIDLDFPSLCKDMRFQRAISLSRSYLNDEIYRFNEIIERMKKVRDLVAAELGSQS